MLNDHHMDKINHEAFPLRRIVEESCLASEHGGTVQEPINSLGVIVECMDFNSYYTNRYKQCYTWISKYIFPVIVPERAR